MEAID